MYNPVKRLITKLGDEDPLLLAHHPTCEYYDHHTMELYGQKVCMGCFIVYPVAFISLISLLTIRLTVLGPEMSKISTLSLYATGIALLTPKVAGKLAPGHRSKTTRIITKTLLAVGLAVIALPFFFRAGDRLMTAGLFFGFLVPYILYKGVTATDDCTGCPEADDFPNCSGLSFDGAYRYAGPDVDTQSTTVESDTE